MLQDFRRRAVFFRIGPSRFWPDLEGLAAFLQQRGHAQKTVKAYLCGAAHLIWCIETGEICLDGLTVKGLQRAAREHRGRCVCPQPRYLGNNFVSVARHLFKVMRTRHGWMSPPVEPPTPVDSVLRLFDSHLRDERGLLESTRERQLRELRVVLATRSGKEHVDLSRWTAQEVRDCVAGRTTVSIHAARVRGVALRSFLRFLALRGQPVGHLVAAVPTTSRSRLAGLPRGLSEEQLAQLLGSVDVSTAIGLRTRAILECLVSLGLRAGEVAALRLGDVDWRTGTLRISRSKGRRGDVLPLSPRVGRAVVAYLKRGRPKTLDDHVFVRHFLPVGQPLISHDVTMVVRRAFRRAGLVLPSMGAHVLRHTTASRLARAGVSLKEIADVMRHRDIDTTRIYTKVDWPRLAEVALPWPTVVS